MVASHPRTDSDLCLALVLRKCAMAIAVFACMGRYLFVWLYCGPCFGEHHKQGGRLVCSLAYLAFLWHCIVRIRSIDPNLFLEGKRDSTILSLHAALGARFGETTVVVGRKFVAKPQGEF